MSDGEKSRKLISDLTFQIQLLNQNMSKQALLQTQALALQTQALTIQAQRLQSDQALAAYMAHLSSKVEELVSYSKSDMRLDHLDGRVAQLDVHISQLVQVLQGEDVPLTPGPLPQLPERGRPFSVPLPTPGQVLGGFVGYGMDHLYGGGRGRGR